MLSRAFLSLSQPAKTHCEVSNCVLMLPNGTLQVLIAELLVQASERVVKSDRVTTHCDGWLELIRLLQELPEVVQPHDQLLNSAEVFVDGAAHILGCGGLVQANQGIVEPNFLAMSLKGLLKLVHVCERLTEAIQPRSQLQDSALVMFHGPMYVLVGGLCVEVRQRVVQTHHLTMRPQSVVGLVCLAKHPREVIKADDQISDRIGVFLHGAVKLLVREQPVQIGERVLDAKLFVVNLQSLVRVSCESEDPAQSAQSICQILDRASALIDGVVQVCVAELRVEVRPGPEDCDECLQVTQSIGKLAYLTEHQAYSTQSHRQLSDRAGVFPDRALQVLLCELFFEVGQRVVDANLLEMRFERRAEMAHVPMHLTEVAQPHCQVSNGAGVLSDGAPQLLLRV